MIFARWDLSVFHCLAEYPGMQLRSPLSSFGWQHQGLWGQELPWGLCHGGGVAAVTPTDQSQPGVFMRRKYFQIILGGKKPVKIVSGFITSPSWLSKMSSQVFSQYFI